MKAETLQRIGLTKEKIKTSFDNFIQDSLTGCYNELFLHEYLVNYFNLLNSTNANRNVVLIYINVDNIVELNSKYSSETGDETLANLSYLLKQIISEEDLLFKKNGPGFILLLHDFQGDNIRDYASQIQNSVKKSEAFIETITVSTAVVCSKELENEPELDDKIDKMFELGQKRINMSHTLGDNSFIDQNTKIEKDFVGNILLIESDQLTLRIIKSFLEKNNFKVYSEDDGVNAVNIAEKIVFDAIIADRYTKKIDGLSIKNYLNESTINMNTLYLLVVQSKNIEIIEKANHLNIDFVLKKPIILEELIGIINRHINLTEKYLT